MVSLSRKHADSLVSRPSSAGASAGRVRQGAMVRRKSALATKSLAARSSPLRGPASSLRRSSSMSFNPHVHRRSPFMDTPYLCSVDMTGRKWTRQAVHSSGEVEVVERGPLYPPRLNREGYREEEARRASERISVNDLAMDMEAIIYSALWEQSESIDRGDRLKQRAKSPGTRSDQNLAQGSNNVGSAVREMAARALQHRTRVLFSRPNAPQVLLQMEDTSSDSSRSSSSRASSASDTDIFSALFSSESRRSATRRRSELAASIRKEPDSALLAELEAKRALAEKVFAPWGEEKLQKLFKMFDKHNDREVHVDDVKNILKLLGISEEASCIEAILREQTRYSTLDWEEFVEFMKRFKAWELNKVRAAFNAADTNQDGLIDLRAASKLLSSLGYRLTRLTVTELAKVEEVVDTSNICFAEFERLLYNVRSNQGFTEKEIQRLRQLYGLALSPNTHELDAVDVWRILLYCGFPADYEVVQRLAVMLDLDGNGNVNFREMVEIIRAHHDRDSADLADLFRQNPHWKEHPPQVLIDRILEHFGYYMSEGATAECLEALGSTEKLTHEDVVLFFELYRSRQGFSEEEVEELHSAFNRGLIGKARTVDVRRLGNVLRWIGYFNGQESFEEVISEIDLTGDKQLDFQAFRTLVFRIRHLRMLRRREVFVSHRVGEWNDRPRAKVEEVTQVLKAIEGSMPNQMWLADAIASHEQKWLRTRSGCMISSFRSFEKFYAEFHRREVSNERETAGYSQSELDWLRLRFRKYDKDDSGGVDAKEMATLLEEVFSQMWPTAQLAKVIREADDDGSGEVSFGEFVWFMREYDDELSLACQMGDVGNDLYVDVEVAMRLRDAFKQGRTSNAAFSKRRDSIE